jgi:hypothetical protein
MTLEKHNMLYAVQFALHEFDETGAVSRRTMEMLGARAILLRYEIEGEVANAMAKKEPPKPEEMPEDIEFTPDEGVDIVFTPEKKEIKRKNGRKNARTAERGSRVNSASFVPRNAPAIIGKQTIGTRPANIICVMSKN